MASSSQRRIRTVEGSCWPCRTRRALCDLQRPTCGKCQKAKIECDFSARRIKWQSGLASRGHLVDKRIPVLDSGSKPTLDLQVLPLYDQAALSYFKDRLWPLLLVGDQTWPAPFDLVLESRPLLLAIIALAIKHRTASRVITQDEKIKCEQARLDCISSFRLHLAQGTKQEKQSRAMVMTSIFLCMLDGYLAPQDEMAATVEHQLGAQAVINIIGGAQKAIARAESCELILLSEFITMDLTRAILVGEKPFVGPELWSMFEHKRAWWGDEGGPDSLTNIFKILATLATYKPDSAGFEADSEIEQRRSFENSLQPVLLPTALLDVTDNIEVSDLEQDQHNNEAQSLCRAFRHCALLYLYRAIFNLSTYHRVVQQKVRDCLEAISLLSPGDRFQHCALFPICVAGAHSLTEWHRTIILQKLESIEHALEFGNVSLIRIFLQELWKPGRQHGDWLDTFQNFNRNMYVL